jgi:anaerobic ribonucleoside-triphosphate reductase activating protein
MRYAAIKENDIANGPGVNVSFWVQGCKNHCKDCQNPETWSFTGGKEFTKDTLNNLFKALKANGINRNLSILGGEPLCPENIPITKYIVQQVKEKYPKIKIYLWSGYYYDELVKNKEIKEEIFPYLDILVDGPYINSQRDITLKWRGSRNQNIIYLKK